ncbi:MAG: hypothetical protein JWO91_112 [Acidobacteriaceae bacterium]|nr:hypothetical protein [Acidobacteriaceae bacterium]
MSAFTSFMKIFQNKSLVSSLRLIALTLVAVSALSSSASAQTCLTSDDMDAATRTALTNTANKYFSMAAKGDGASLRQNSIPAIASDFTGIQNVIDDNKANFSAGSASARPPYLLKAEGTAPLQRAEFLCGLFSANGQTANSSEFVIPNLPPGNYAVVILDVTTPKGPYTDSFVLQQQGTDWKLGGYYVKQSAVGGHDGNWFADRARAFKAKGQTHDAWLYYIEARELLAPVNFMYTQKTDKLYDEMQTVKPADLPPSDLNAGAKTYKLTDEFPTISGKDLDLVVKYQSPDVSDTGKTFQDNMAVMKALVTKYPELRDGFEGFVARAVEPSGRDYGSLMSMKDIK